MDDNDFYSLFNTKIIKWQNKIYQHMLSNKKVTFDKVALDFLVKNALGENEELSEYWNDCHNSFRLALAKLKKENPHTDITIEYMDAIFDSNEKPLLLIKKLV